MRSRLLLPALFVACGSFGGDQASPVDPTGADAGADADVDPTACGGPCEDGTVCEAGVCRPGCRDRILYVSTEGTDASSGCSRDAPLRTVGGALALAVTRKLEGHEIHICRGRYVEPRLVLDYPVSIRGGYNCSTWTRADGFGSAGGFKDVNATEIAAPAGADEALTIRGAPVTRDVVVEGLTFLASTEGPAAGYGVVIAEASPTLSDVVVRGGATAKANGMGSVGIFIRTGAKPEIKSSHVSGGEGSGTIGSIGMLVSSSEPYVHGSFVDGGSGTGTNVGAIAVYVEGTSSARIEGNRLTWGRPTVTTGSIAAIGLRVFGAQVSVTGNQIIGGTGTCQQNVCVDTAIELYDAKASKFLTNTIRHGVMRGAKDPSFRLGLRLSGPSAEPAEIVGNIIHTGGAGAPAIAPYAIDLLAGDGHVVLANTIVVASTQARHRVGIRVGANETLVAKNVVLGGNIIVGADIGVSVAGCSGSSLLRVENNLFVANAGAVTFDDCGSLDAYPLGMEARSPTTRTGNLAIRPSCAASCVPGVTCTDLGTCAGAIFTAWDVASNGELNAGDPAKGLRLRADGRCEVNRGGVASSATDLYGQPRTSPFSMGAAEENACAASR